MNKLGRSCCVGRGNPLFSSLCAQNRSGFLGIMMKAFFLSLYSLGLFPFISLSLNSKLLNQVPLTVLTLVILVLIFLFF